MKKSLLIALTFLGLALGSLNAQSCCTNSKEKCNPKVCCPSSSNSDDTTNKKSAESIKATNTSTNNNADNQKNVAIKNEDAIVETKK